MTYSNEASAIIDQLSDQPIAYHPDLARAIGSVKAALFLGQLLYWNGKGIREDGWIWKTVAEMEGETALTRSEQMGARIKLEQAGVIETKRMGACGRLHYRLNLGALQENLQSCLGKTDKPDIAKPAKPLSENQQTGLQKTDELDCGKPAIQIAENLRTISENTTQNTQEITSPPVADKQRQSTGRNLVKKQLEDAFVELTGIPPPALKTARDRKAAGQLWYRPLFAIGALENDNVERATALMGETVRQMDTDGLTISTPASILKVATAIHGRRVRQGGNGPGRILKVA